jgi:hypothetical protein
LELHTDFNDLELEEFSELVSNMYPIQRLNDYNIKETQTKIEFDHIEKPELENVIQEND